MGVHHLKSNQQRRKWLKMELKNGQLIFNFYSLTLSDNAFYMFRFLQSIFFSFKCYKQNTSEDSNRDQAFIPYPINGFCVSGLGSRAVFVAMIGLFCTNASLFSFVNPEVFNLSFNSDYVLISILTFLRNVVFLFVFFLCILMFQQAKVETGK